MVELVVRWRIVEEGEDIECSRDKWDNAKFENSFRDSDVEKKCGISGAKKDVKDFILVIKADNVGWNSGFYLSEFYLAIRIK